jgi:hypothetical protein
MSEEYCQQILKYDGLILLMVNTHWRTSDSLIELIKKASHSQLLNAFTILSSVINTSQANVEIFTLVLKLFQFLDGAMKPDSVTMSQNGGDDWDLKGSGGLSRDVIQTLIDSELIEATLGIVLSVGDRTNYEICCDILLAFSYNAQDLILPMGLLEAFISFHPKGARKSCSLNVLFACVVNLSSHDSHLPLIEQSGLIQMLFSHEISDDLLLQIQKLMQRTQENGRTQFFRHLVNCGLITVFVSAYKWKSKLKAVSCQAIVECLLMIMRADEEFKKILDAMKLPRLLAPLLVKGFSN